MGFSLGKVVKSVTSAFNPKTYYDKAVNLLDQTKYGSDYSYGMNMLQGQSPYSSIIQGAVGLGQDMLTGWWNTQQQQKLNDQAFSQNLKMWNLQNAYNDPSAQMIRLERAGLNKNLVYGGGNVTGNTTSNYPTYEPVKYSGVGSFLSRNQQKEIAMAQLDLGMKEFQQRVTNQGIQNAIALEKLNLYGKINDALLKNYEVNRGYTVASTKGKTIENKFNENPLGNLNTGYGWNFALKLLTSVFH